MSFWGTLGKVGLGVGGVGASFLPGIGPMIGQAALGALGNTMQASAANQPEKWRQALIEQELNRRNQMQAMAAPTMAGMLGYRSPAMGQQMAATLGAPSAKVKK